MNKETKIINLFGGPGSGKSTTAAGIFHLMKMEGYSVEMVTEFAKDLVWEGRHHALSDQIYVFAKQQNKMNKVIGKVDYIICDSPVILSLLYKTDDLPQAFSDLVLWKHNESESLNFFLNRPKEYQQEGRYQNESEAIGIDLEIKKKLFDNMIKFKEVENGNINYILRNI